MFVVQTDDYWMETCYISLSICSEYNNYNYKCNYKLYLFLKKSAVVTVYVSQLLVCSSSRPYLLCHTYPALLISHTCTASLISLLLICKSAAYLSCKLWEMRYQIIYRMFSLSFPACYFLTLPVIWILPDPLYLCLGNKAWFVSSLRAALRSWSESWHICIYVISAVSLRMWLVSQTFVSISQVL